MTTARRAPSRSTSTRPNSRNTARRTSSTATTAPAMASGIGTVRSTGWSRRWMAGARCLPFSASIWRSRRTRHVHVYYRDRSRGRHGQARGRMVSALDGGGCLCPRASCAARRRHHARLHQRRPRTRRASRDRADLGERKRAARPGRPGDSRRRIRGSGSAGQGRRPRPRPGRVTPRDRTAGKSQGEAFGIAVLAILLARADEVIVSQEDIKKNVKVCMFDQYGTVVDMQGGLTAIAAPFLKEKGWRGNPSSVVTWWRRTHFENSMIDALLHKEHTPYREIGRRAVDYTLERAKIKHTDEEVRILVDAITRLPAFPEVGAAIDRLRGTYELVILSNGDPDMLASGVPFAGVAFDRVISVATANAFKPHVASYRKACEIAGADPSAVLFVANHAFD